MLNAIIIDDESVAIETLELLIKEYVPELKIVSTASNIVNKTR